MPRKQARPGRRDPVELGRLIAGATGASTVELGERVQTLWGGYGEIRRATLGGASIEQVVVKCVIPPHEAPGTEAEARSHRRKLRSYEIERAFYRIHARRCGTACRVPAALHESAEGDRTLLILEDLDAAGFALRRNRVSSAELTACLRWLAAFHATFLGASPEPLWRVGTYWHLGTRPDELRALSDPALRRAAPALDERLNRARFKTFVHGDAKLQNFCFGRGGAAVAAVDFQYAGGGVGVKDVAYFLTSCLSAGELERHAEAHLDEYFDALREALTSHGLAAGSAAVELEWRELYPFACADFYRFLCGWAGHDAHDAYLERITTEVLRP